MISRVAILGPLESCCWSHVLSPYCYWPAEYHLVTTATRLARNAADIGASLNTASPLDTVSSLDTASALDTATFLNIASFLDNASSLNTATRRSSVATASRF